MTVTQPPPSMKSPVSVWTSGSQRLIQGEDGPWTHAARYPVHRAPRQPRPPPPTHSHTTMLAHRHAVAVQTRRSCRRT